MDWGAPRDRKSTGFLAGAMLLCQWRQEIDPCSRFRATKVGELGVCNEHLPAATRVRTALREAASGLREWLDDDIESP